jgi:hypothetical protein
MAFLARWRQHNVEEGKRVPRFLRELYSQEVST